MELCDKHSTGAKLRGNERRVARQLWQHTLAHFARERDFRRAVDGVLARNGRPPLPRAINDAPASANASSASAAAPWWFYGGHAESKAKWLLERDVTRARGGGRAPLDGALRADARAWDARGSRVGRHASREGLGSDRSPARACAADVGGKKSISGGDGGAAACAGVPGAPSITFQSHAGHKAALPPFHADYLYNNNDDWKPEKARSPGSIARSEGRRYRDLERVLLDMWAFAAVGFMVGSPSSTFDLAVCEWRAAAGRRAEDSNMCDLYFLLL